MPDVLVHVVLLAVGEAGPGLAGDEERAVGERRLEQHARRVADDRGYLPCLVEAPNELVHARLVDEGDHRPLAADEEDPVVGGRVEVGQRPALLDEGRVLGRGDKAEAEDVLGRKARLVAGVRPSVGGERAAVGAVDVDLVAVLGQLPVRVHELRPPESDRPAGDRGDGGVRDEDRDPLRLRGIEDVDAGSHKLSF